MTILDNDLVRSIQADRVAASLRNVAVLQAHTRREACESPVGHNHSAPVQLIASLIARLRVGGAAAAQALGRMN